MSGLLHLAGLLLSNLALLFLFCLSGLGYGWAGLRGLRYTRPARIEAWLTAQALGLVILSSLAFGLGALGWITRLAVWVVLAAGLVILGGLSFRARNQIQGWVKSAVHFQFSWFTAGMGLWILAGLAFMLFANGLVPSTAYDELAYHLAIPKLYIQSHAIVYIPYILQSNWPLGTELLFMLGLLLGSETLANLMTWLCLLFFVSAVIHWGTKWFGQEAGWLAGGIILSTPMVLSLAGVALVEIPAGLFSFLSAAFLIDWLEEADWKRLIVSAIFAGFVAAIKLNGVQVPLILGSLILIEALLHRRSSFRQALADFSLYGSIALLVVLPWYIKTWLFTGNPVWPFLYNIFGGKNWDADTGRYLMNYLQVTNLKPGWMNWLTGLFQVSLDSQGKFGSFLLGYTYLALLPLAIWAMFALRQAESRRITRRLAFLTLALYTTWFFQTHQTRFLLPSLGVFALLDTAGVALVWQRGGKRVKLLTQLALLVFLILVSGMLSAGERAQLASNWPYLSGKMNRDQYLTARIPGYAVYSYANQNLPGDAYVLMAVWESRGFLLDRRYHWANPISQRAIHLNEFSNADELAAELQRLGFTHVLINYANLFRFPYPDNQKTADLMDGLLKNHARLLYQSDPMALYQLQP